MKWWMWTGLAIGGLWWYSQRDPDAALKNAVKAKLPTVKDVTVLHNADGTISVLAQTLDPNNALVQVPLVASAKDAADAAAQIAAYTAAPLAPNQ